ncbi:restriction endonuclease subunit S [Thermococcus barophilus]|uniref:Type I restriction-modification enzyme, S subunit n=1 Tax=Thermococcus barophilus TaxID=55802 RepID=A0A0S1XE32_THEBA|nr:restriction endonuclease subunit S [Thermococcus barophilus]ALM76057.1 type I restriction-modification enzyme, S subunit [Thermococcus barophilus]
MNSFEFFRERRTVSTNLNGLKIEIPYDWKIVKLEKVAKVGSGKKPHVQNDGEVPVYGKSLLGFTTVPMVESGKVIVMSNFPRPFSPQIIKAPLWVTSGFLYIVPQEDVILAEYLKLFLEFLGPDIILPPGSNVPRISARRLANLNIILPPTEEQKAIVRIFQLFDVALETGEKTADLVNKLKKATIDTMFVKFMEHYPRVKVGDVATLVRRSPQVPDAVSLPIISAARLPSGTIYFKAEDAIESDKKTKAKTAFKPGEILYVRQNPKLDRTVVSTFKGLATADIFVISVDTNKILPEYLVLILHSSDFLNYAERVSSSTVLPRMSWRDLSNFQFPLPPLDVQRNVVSGVVKLDELERVKTKKSNLLKDLRSYLLDTLITGKVRITI